jgi:tRNA nucleotidyltransferase (CCA-adding enzyme)
MDIYKVGGAVRDALLGLPQADRDWVVVGADPDHMLAAGYLPVGQDFPVFLHPQTKEEYALARTERRTGRGYQGFAFYAAPDVTLAQDLSRRDLSINALAVPANCGDSVADIEAQLIDPCGGLADLRAGVLRHVGPAFREDPVRILRIARFAARFADFCVSPDTLALLRDMVAEGEAHDLVAERVWQELAKGLMERQPSRMFLLLRQCGALRVLLPELDALWGVPQSVEHHPEIDTGVHAMMVLDVAAQLGAPLAVRWACLVHDLGKGETPAHVLPRHIGHEERSVQLARRVAERWRVPADHKALAEVVAREHGNIHRSADLSPDATLRLLERCDALRRPERMAQVLLACECDARGRLGFEHRAYPQRPRLLAALQSALGVNTAALAQAAQAKGLKGAGIARWIAQARVQAMTAFPPELGAVS